MWTVLLLWLGSIFSWHVADGIVVLCPCYIHLESGFQCWFVETWERLTGMGWLELCDGHPSETGDISLPEISMHEYRK